MGVHWEFQRRRFLVQLSIISGGRRGCGGSDFGVIIREHVFALSSQSFIVIIISIVVIVVVVVVIIVFFSNAAVDGRIDVDTAA